MSLPEHIKIIQASLRANDFSNEASVSSGILVRLLEVLGWPVFDSQVVCPEFSLEGRRVDYALCHPRRKPRIFIEVKSHGKLKRAGRQLFDAERQLFEYAFHLGVPLVILTDGQEWYFFLPGEEGSYDERRVYNLDLLARDEVESVPIRLSPTPTICMV